MGLLLPKDTKQLLANFADVPQNLIRAIVKSNETRISFMAEQILAKRPKTVGVYRLVMKAGSDNFRASAIQSVMAQIQQAGIPISIYEPVMNQHSDFEGYPINNNLAQFKQHNDIIIANRNHTDLADVSDKLFTRDVFGVD